MNKLKKLLVVTGTTMLGMAVLTGCGTNSSSTQTTQSSSRTKPSYDINGLSEKVAGKTSFYTSKKDDWKDNSTGDETKLQLVDTESEESVSIAVMERDFTGAQKSLETVKAELEKAGATNAQISKSTLNNKETLKLSYELSGAKGEQNYVELDKTHVAIVTYRKESTKNTTNTIEKEVKHIVNTIEYLK